MATVKHASDELPYLLHFKSYDGKHCFWAFFHRIITLTGLQAMITGQTANLGDQGLTMSEGVKGLPHFQTAQQADEWAEANGMVYSHCRLD